MAEKPAKKSAKKGASKAASNKTAATMGAPGLPADLKQALAKMLQSMNGGEPVPPQDLDALLHSLQNLTPENGVSDEKADARFRAQELAFSAMEAATRTEAIKLSKRAVRLDPDCVDALVLLARLESPSQRAMIQGLQKAVAAGERSLGDDFIRQNTGHFWLHLDTRPYMRALEVLAGELARAGILRDAIAIYERMLVLNPNDNQGVRDPLLGLCLQAGDLAQASALLNRYDDASANFAWGRVLERFLAGDLPGAAAALVPAQRANRFLALYLTGERPIPQSNPEMYSLGSEEEAVLCMSWVGKAWSRNKEAIFWLHDQLAQSHKTAPSKAALRKVPARGKHVN
ncbi:MAG: hypothetical protein WCE75_03600 [Terracidiphilus sp.]